MIVDIRQLMTWAIKWQVECLLELLVEIFAISFFSRRILLNKVSTVIIVKIGSKGLRLTLCFLRKLIFCTLGKLLLRLGSEKSLSVESHLIFSKLLWFYCSKVGSKVCPFHVVWPIRGRLIGRSPWIQLIRQELRFLDPACIWAKYAAHLSLLRIIIVLIKNWIQIRDLFLILFSFSNGY